MNTECPVPVSADETVRLGHGSGGELSQRLLREHIYPHINNAWIEQGHDSATLPRIRGRTVFTTDSFVITPLFFPGGDIGELAVYGTVNDLAMSGARPLYLSCSLILEEGLPMKTLAAVMASMGKAAVATGVELVTGDTKVVERGKGDGMYINTAGIGSQEQVLSIAPDRIQPGDVILISGDIGRHGMAVMARREGLEFDGPLISDCAPLHEPVLALLAAGINVRCLRDLTRGGLATALVELAESSGRQFLVREDEIAISEPVLGACEILGLDPLYVANEGRFVAFVPPLQVDQALAVLARWPVSANCRVLGTVAEGGAPHGGGPQAGVPQVILQNSIGCERLLDRLPGEQLPRIC